MKKKPQHKVEATIQAKVSVVVDAEDHRRAVEAMREEMIKLGLMDLSVIFCSTQPIGGDDSEESGTSPSSLENEYHYGVKIQ